MIDFKSYMEKHFQPLDIIGTTSYGPIAREIWRNTWAKGKLSAMFIWYKHRANLSTHTAITCLGRNGKKWIMEMDNTQKQKRYISTDLKNMIDPEEYKLVEHSLSGSFREVNIFSGVILSKSEKYYAENICSPHICWIGRFPQLTDPIIKNGNEWLFERFREGVSYDYLDILAQWKLTETWKILGSSNIYICSELVQRCFEHCGILAKQDAPMTPMNWQKLSNLITLTVKEQE